MYYEEYGDKANPTIVFLHCAAIVGIYTRFYSLQDRYHLVIPHFFGSGREIDEDFSFEGCGRAVVEIIEALGKQGVYLIGHSLGANVALSLVTNRPDLFKRVIISSPMIDTKDKAAKHRSAFIGFNYNLIKSKAIGGLYAKAIRLDKEGKSAFLDYWVRVKKSTWENFYSDRLTFDSCAALEASTVPMLLLAGKLEIPTIHKTVETISSIDPCATLEYIPWAGHGHPVKKYNVTLEAILGFFIDSDT